MEEEDFFSDDDLKDLPDDTLQELEQHAWSSTQKQSVLPAVAQRKQAHNASSLTRASNLNHNLPWRPPQRSQPQSKPVAPGTSAAHSAAAVLDSFNEYGLDEDEVIDLNDKTALAFPPTQLARLRPGSRARLASTVRDGNSRKTPTDSQTEAAYAAADAELAHESFGHSASADKGDANNTDVSMLRARISELESKQTQLIRAAQEARDAALARQGEIAIVRANQDKASKEYERRIATLQQKQADENARHKTELDARGKEMEKMQTDNRFLQHEAVQEAERVKRVNGVSKTRTVHGSRETPRKSRRQVLGDGFDDEEVQQFSPSRNRDKSREATPKAGGKRKRPTPDSPVGSLIFRYAQAPQSLQHESSESLQAPSEPSSHNAAGTHDGQTFEVVQRVLNHMPPDGNTPAVEALSKFAFPSLPARSVSSLFMDDFTTFLGTNTTEFSMTICRSLLKLWARCHEDNYFAPFPLIIDLLRFMLHFEPASFAAKLIEEAIPLCSTAVDLTTIHLSKAAIDPNYEHQVDWEARTHLETEVDSLHVLELLLSLCHASSLSPERAEAFWRCIPATFVFTLLSRALPITHITIGLQMLKTSRLADTFGPIREEPEFQPKQEDGIVERLTNLLFECPQPPKDQLPYMEEELLEFRIEVLQVLQIMCLTDHGGMVIASHRTAIGRLVRFLDDQVSILYESRPSLGMQPFDEAGAQELSAHDLITQTINLGTRIFYHILRTYDDSFDIIQKLNVVSGGYHKFLVSLTRIAFTEQLVLEAGIEEEVAMAAHTILDNILGPEDGDAIVQAVETPRGTRGSTNANSIASGQRTEHGEDATMDDPS